VLSGGHSGIDGLENAIVFESNEKLDLYCLYVHSVDAVKQVFETKGSTQDFEYTIETPETGSIVTYCDHLTPIDKIVGLRQEQARLWRGKQNMIPKMHGLEEELKL
jgi:hypothetical protein